MQTIERCIISGYEARRKRQIDGTKGTINVMFLELLGLDAVGSVRAVKAHASYDEILHQILRVAQKIDDQVNRPHYLQVTVDAAADNALQVVEDFDAGTKWTRPTHPVEPSDG